jgi:hypothetical protein
MPAIATVKEITKIEARKVEIDFIILIYFSF